MKRCKQANGSAGVSQTSSVTVMVSRKLLDKKKMKKVEKMSIAHDREETYLYSKFFNDSIQVSRANSDLNRIIFIC